MRYAHLIRYVQETPWAIAHDKVTEILDVLLMRVDGHRLSAEEIHLRVGEAMGQHAERIEGAASVTRARGGGVAVVPIMGTIFHRMAESMDESSGGTSTGRIRDSLRQAVAMPDIGTILLDVHSPGGTVPGVGELADDIFKAREAKRIVALADSQMASAAYWIASQANEIVAIPSASVGSIGVFGVHEDLSERAKQLGIKVTMISAGKYKMEGNPFEPLSEAATARFQTLVDAAYDSFVDAVARGRGVSSSTVRTGFGQGRALMAKEAKEAGLIDRIATREETIVRLTRKLSPAAADDKHLRALRLRV